MNKNVVDNFITTCKSQLKVFYTNPKKTQASCRCPYCGDSLKSPRSAHFYIQLKPPFKYYCQRCQNSGIVTPNTLKDLKVNDSNLTVQIYEVNKNIKYMRNVKSKSAGFQKMDALVPTYKGTKGELERLLYLNNRLGTDITIDEASEKFRLILNFKQFIVENKLNLNIPEESEKYIDLVNKLNQDCVGFLNYERSGIIFRSLDDDWTGFRYHHYNIFDEEESLRFYAIASNVDILKPKLKVVITEGIIDIIGVYSHFYRDEDNENTLFLAVNGKGYNLVFQHLVRLGFLDMDISIYSDSDVDVRFYRYLKQQNPAFNDSKWTIYYNKIGKDYGVPKEKILLKHTII